MENIKAEIRNNHGSCSGKRERKHGKVPGIVYGKNEPNIMIDIDAKELSKRISQNGQYGFLNVNINGQNHKTLIKEIQREPVSNKLMHIDLEDINDNSKIVSEIPVVFDGTDIIKAKGYIAQKFKNSIKVKCQGANLPENISIDISPMNAGENLRVCDIEFAKEITIVDDLEAVLVNITDSWNGAAEEKIEEDVEKDTKEDSNNKG